MFKFNNDWDEQLGSFCSTTPMVELEEKLNTYYSNSNAIYPPKSMIFNALETTTYKETKVIILGQDPYHQKGQAHGLSFSVPEGINHPPSLRNIFKELKDDLGIVTPTSGNLAKWAHQGVLLLNTTLTVVDSSPLSHNSLGWEDFTTEVIRKLLEKKSPVCFILWGAHAKRKVKSAWSKGLRVDHHHFLSSAHPSPLSAYRGFLGSKPFSQANEFLFSKGLAPVDWSL